MFNKGGKVSAQQQLQPERGARIYERNYPTDTKVSEERGGRSASGARAQMIPLQPVMQTLKR